MSINILCTQCNKKLSVAESALGKKIRCPKCQAVFVASDEDLTEAVAPEPIKKRTPPPPPPHDDVEEVDDDAPRQPKKKKKRREVEAKPFTPIKFRAIVKKKTDVLKKGNYQATLDEEGLIIKVNRKESIDIPRRTPIEHQNKNIIEVEIEGEWVTIAVMRFRTYNNRFSQAVVDFMNGDISAVYVEDYAIPWAMFILVVLPLFSPLVALLIGAIPFAIAAGISGANFAIISKEDWTPGLRVTIAALITGLLYLAAIAILTLQIVYAMRFGPRF